MLKEEHYGKVEVMISAELRMLMRPRLAHWELDIITGSQESEEGRRRAGNNFA